MRCESASSAAIEATPELGVPDERDAETILGAVWATATSQAESQLGVYRTIRAIELATNPSARLG